MPVRQSGLRPGPVNAFLLEALAVRELVAREVAEEARLLVGHVTETVYVGLQSVPQAVAVSHRGFAVHQVRTGLREPGAQVVEGVRLIKCSDPALTVTPDDEPAFLAALQTLGYALPI